MFERDKTLTIRIYSYAGVVRMRYNGHGVLGGEVQHTANRCWFRLIKRHHTFERNSAIALGGLNGDQTETLSLFGSPYFVENVSIVLGGVDEIAVYRVELERGIEILD